MKNNDIHFEDRELDPLFIRWMAEGLEPGELNEWKKILLYNHDVREKFCDWVKGHREPGWRSQAGGSETSS